MSMTLDTSELSLLMGITRTSSPLMTKNATGSTEAPPPAKAETHRDATYGNHRRFARLNGLTNNRFRLGNEAELFQKSFCKFFDSHVLNIIK